MSLGDQAAFGSVGVKLPPSVIECKLTGDKSMLLRR